MTHTQKRQTGKAGRISPAALLGTGCLALLTAVSAASCTTERAVQTEGTAMDREQAAGRVEKYAEKLMKERHITGLSIAVADSGGILWERGFGLSDRTKRRTFTADTLSLPGSVSKLFTATSVMILCDRGLVDIDAPLVRYLPSLSIQTDGWPLETMTVRDVLTHHSGLPSDVFKGMYSGSIAGMEDAAALPALISRAWCASRPGEQFSYSNLGYSLLGSLVEKVSGKSLGEFVREEIFLPLGMEDSFFGFSEQERESAARGYSKKGEEQVPCLRDIGAGGLLTTAHDMGKFLSALLSIRAGKGGILEAKTLETMWSVQNGGVGGDLDFHIGLGWWLGPYAMLPGERLVVHGGDWLPFVSLVTVLPEKDLAVFIMANSIDGSGSMTLEPLATEALCAFTQSERGIVLERGKGVASHRVLPVELQRELAGDWISMMGLIRIRKTSHSLKIHFAGQWFDGVLRSDGGIGIEKRILGLKLPIAELEEYSVSPELLGGKRVLAFRCHGILLCVCQRPQIPPIAPEWRQRLGSWRLSNPDPDSLVSKITLGVDAEGRLIWSYCFLGGMSRDYPLETVSADRARFQGMGRNLGESITVRKNGSEETLEWSGYSLVR